MFEDIRNVQLLNVISDLSSKHLRNGGRPSHALVFKISGSSRYTFEKPVQSQLVLSSGKLLFIPRSSIYLAETVTEGDNRHILFNFDADIISSQIRALVSDMRNFDRLPGLSPQLAKQWLLDKPGNHYHCVSMLYSLLAYLAENEINRYLGSKSLNRIRPAMEYLREHLLDPSLRVSDLANMCGISETYFRNIFESSYGMPPQKYITKKRMLQARYLLENGDFDSISSVANAVGYSDSLYFSKVFRACYGCSPRNYAENSSLEGITAHIGQTE